MSPAPQGGLEVERYIGSCLISQSARAAPNKQFFQNNTKKVVGDGAIRHFVLNPHDSPCHASAPRYSLPSVHGEFYPQHGWAGMPLFCVASNGQRRNRKGPTINNQSPKPPGRMGLQNKPMKCSTDVRDAEANNRLPLSRLAIHTQGAPLIQAGRYNKIGFNRGPPPLRIYRSGDTAPRRTDSSRETKATQSKEPGACDSVSVASDESSANSENSLPRIIKPRKRRKKDRKPAQTSQNTKPDDDATPHASEERKSVNQTSLVEPFISSSITTETTVNPSVEAIFSDETDASLLPRCGEDLPSELEQDEGPASSCQCRYCDPVGVIWDVDQRCYSPFLTPPSPTELKTSYPFRDYDLGSILRRSWSEPSSTPVVQLQQRTRALSESQTQSSQPQSLEVSSEIITSPNGHRDIEIKFFSSKPAGGRQFKVEE